MADPSTYRPALGSIPTDPGVYQFRDAHGRVIYVGKAKSLRSRLSSYFQDPSALHPRTVTMVTTAASVEWTVVRTEVEALQLEYSWIKEFDPRFNVKYRDDKSYPFLAVTMDETYPRAQVMRGNKRKGVRYFGPYGHAWAIRETLDLLLRVFPLRTCSAGVFKRAAASGRPCLLGYIDKCSAPCVGRVTAEEHRQIAVDFCDFMAGATGTFVRRLQREMKQAAADLEFERAARLRDDLGAVTRALEKQAVVFADATDADVFAMAEDDLEAAAQVFHVRGGRIRGQRGWVVERAGEDTATSAGLVARLLEQVYGSGGAEAVPHEILVPALPDDLDVITDWLTGLRGARVDIRVPRRGDKRTLQETAFRNATQALTRHKLARSGDLTKRSQALADLQRDLDLDEAPLRIECFDISHVQGTNMVASMVVFEDGLPTKSEYRHFAIREATDDAGAMAEVLTRRFTRLLEESSAAAQAVGMPGVGKTGVGLPDDAAEPPEPASAPAPAPAPARKARRFAYPPQLVVVDGGAPQVNAARQVLDGLGVQGVDVIGLAKRLEEVWLPGEEFPVVLQRTSEGLYLLQRARDEAHRFAISYHRQRRSTAMTTSVLDGIPGVGPARRKALLAAFGTVKALRTASADEVAAVPGIGPVLAETIVSELAKDTATRAPVVNVTTGEVE